MSRTEGRIVAAVAGDDAQPPVPGCWCSSTVGWGASRESPAHPRPTAS